ncbi:MAG: hypothetical protein ACRDTH_10640 [Pseudonocardiaceae bacterium]
MAPVALRLVTLTDVRTGAAHQVTDEAIVAGRRAAVMAVLGADDDAHDATAFVGTVAGSSSTCRADHRPGRQTAGQEVLPRRFRSSALRACGAGLLAIGLSGQLAQHATRNIVTVTAPIGRIGAGSYP